MDARGFGFGGETSFVLWVYFGHAGSTLDTRKKPYVVNGGSTLDTR